MKRRLFLLLAAVFVLAGVGVVCLALMSGAFGPRTCSGGGFAQPPTTVGPTNVLITFLGHTNWSGPDSSSRWKQETQALFRLTNASSRRVNYYAQSIEVWTADGWQTNRIAATPQWPCFPSVLAPHHSAEFRVPIPAARWRIRLMSTEHAAGWSGQKDSLRDAVDNYKSRNSGNSVQIESFTGPRAEIESKEVLSPRP